MATKLAPIDRWQLAFERADQERITARRIAGTARWIVTSGTDPHLCYELSFPDERTVRCPCPAGRYGAACKHIAAFYQARHELAGRD